MRLRQGIRDVVHTRRHAIAHAHEEMRREGKEPILGWRRSFLWALWLPLAVLAMTGYWIPLAVYAFMWVLVFAWALFAAWRKTD